MGRLLVNVTDQVRACSSESSAATILTVDSTPIHFEGSLENRRMMVAELARSVGLGVFIEPIPRQDLFDLADSLDGRVSVGTPGVAG